MEVSHVEGARVVVTGAAGTVGKELLRQLARLPVAEIRALDNNETELFYLSELYRNDQRIQTFLVDVCQQFELIRAFQSIDIVIHAAAFKHVPLCERSPSMAVQANIIGVQNVIQAARHWGVSKVLFTSSDKAVNPTNVMGTSKLMGERLITAANATEDADSKRRYFSTRFGNIAGSRGSVIPLFTRQIRDGGPVTLTAENMTRFIMTLEDAVELLLENLSVGCGGEVFVMKMPVLRIVDLAEVMIEELAPLFGHRPRDIPIRIIGARPGEKPYEELMTATEMAHSVELGHFFSIIPAFRNIYDPACYEYGDISNTSVDKPYVSSTEPAMDREEIRHFLARRTVLEDEVRTALVEQRKRSLTLQRSAAAPNGTGVTPIAAGQ